ncbi:hypothetical protein QMK33_06010 [Hymenobacter sp. H14-R3]|uniref:hypothetical protein n=1 Tax=Hymenobacter sp. H14-R3 TaxID=3046308 RepID=UPI0024BA2BC1|nr:hypothetical protein [Hymenobacter sp. H14-R3]MDJ0364701.1 hypothetical protein [Hymenobacter sp. H14-R3]
MIPPFMARRPPGDAPTKPTPPATGWEQVRQGIEAARLYQALDLQAAVQAWELTRPVQRLTPVRAARQDGHLAYVKRQHYETALHGAQAARLAAEARVQSRITYVRTGPTPIERAMREAAVRDPFAAAWGADPLNRQIAVSVLTVGMGRVLAPASAGVARLASRLTYAKALRAGGEFGVRALTDGVIQFFGGLAAHDGNFEEAVGEVNITSMGMAGLPGDGLGHSIRNNLISNSLEWKLDFKEGTKFEPMTFDQPGLLNFGQKVVIGVGVDYATGRLNAMVQPARGASSSAIKRSLDPNTVWLHRQRLRYLNIFLRGTDGFKVSGEAGSNLLEDQIKAIYKTDEQP